MNKHLNTGFKLFLLAFVCMAIYFLMSAYSIPGAELAFALPIAKKKKEEEKEMDEDEDEEEEKDEDVKALLGKVRAAAKKEVLQTGREIGRASVGKECRSRWSPYH